jgi:hypothetical protein
LSKPFKFIASYRSTVKERGVELTLSGLHYITVRAKSKFKTPEADNTSKTNNSVLYRLAEFKKTALRRGKWFKTLSRIERGIIDLTVKNWPK